MRADPSQMPSAAAGTAPGERDPAAGGPDAGPADHRIAWIAFLAAALLCVLFYGLNAKPAEPEGGDSPAYLAAAYHLFAHGTYTQAMTAEPSPPSVGREPGYAMLLAGLMALFPSFGDFTPECLTGARTCGASMFVPVQWTNAVLIGLSGVLLFATALRLTGSAAAAFVAGGYLLLNIEMHGVRRYVLSDHLAVFLVTLLYGAVVWAVGRAGRSDGGAGRPPPGLGAGRAVRWVAVGAVLTALVLTKTVFLVYALAALAVAIVWAVLAGGRESRAILAGALGVALVSGTVLSAWGARNASVGKVFAITDERSGIALSTREVFNDMTPAQYLASFVYWTRGFGDDLAKDLFDPAVVREFDLGTPGGFYDRGQNGYGRRVDAVVAAEGVDAATARARIDAALRAAIVERPFTHMATTLPLIYRGMWIDEFILIGLPALIWACVRAVRRRRRLELALLSLGAFNLVFYALVSLNVTRYQMTAVPALALATALAIRAWRGRRTLRP